MELLDYVAIARRWWWLLAASLVVGAGVAFGVSTQITPTYRATATLVVGETSADVKLSDVQRNERLAKTFSTLITARPVLQEADRLAGLGIAPGELARRVSVATPPSTQLLKVTAEARSADLASRIANAVAEAFARSEQAGGTGAQPVVRLADPAHPPASPASPRTTLNAALGGILALMAVSGLVLLMEYLDDTVRSPARVYALTGLPTLGRLPEFAAPADDGGDVGDRLPAAHEPRSTIGEAYRATRANLLHALDVGRDRRVVLVTSPAAGEGKTTTVANLAVVLGLAGYRVCVLDADLRQPAMRELFDQHSLLENVDLLSGASGLADLLRSRDLPVESAIQRTAATNVWAVVSGALPRNPSELLGSARMLEVVQALRSRFDVVLIDSPRSLSVSDASVLAPLADAAVIVARAGKTRAGDLADAVEQLALTDCPLAGVILTGVPAAAIRFAPYGGPREAAEETTAETVEESDAASTREGVGVLGGDPGGGSADGGL